MTSKIRRRYDEIQNSRPRTILLSNEEFFALECGFNHQQPDTESRPLLKTTENRCRATKMDGNICNAKVKIGDFCKRHSKSI